MMLKRVRYTLQLMLYAMLPSSRHPDTAPAGGTGPATPPSETGAALSLAPREIRGGMARFLDGRGELRLFFPDSLALAAPFVLFRLKREGFSRCLVQASHRGLYVQGRR